VVTSRSKRQPEQNTRYKYLQLVVNVFLVSRRCRLRAV
jgi:hypothetical protein